MQDRLKEYIKNNRDKMDTLQPSEALWGKLSVRLDQLPPQNGFQHFNGWKTFTMIALPVVVTLAVLLSGPNQDKPPVIQQAATTVSQEEPVNEEAVTYQPQPAKISVVPEEEHTAERPEMEELIPKRVGAYQEPSDRPDIDLQLVDVRPVAPQPVRTAQPAQKKNPEGPSSGYVGTTTITKNEWHLMVDTLFSAVNKLEVQGSICDFNINRTAADELSLKGMMEIKVRGIHGKLGDGYKVHYTKTDSTLSIRIEGDCAVKGFMGSLSKHTDINIGVPASVREMIIKTSSGDVAVHSFEGNNLLINTMSGDIEAGDIQAPLTAKSISGDFELTNMKGDVTALSSSGNQTFRQLKGNLVAKSASGDIFIEGMKGDATVKSVSGKHTCLQLKGTVLSVSTSGDVEVDDLKGDLTVTTVSGSVVAKNVTASANLDFTSTSGDIEVALINDINELKFDLKTTSGNLSIRKNDVVMVSDNALKTSKGNVTVKAATVSGNQRFR